MDLCSVKLLTSTNISQKIDLVEILINFASLRKARPSQTIRSYFRDVLKFPDTKCVISLKVSNVATHEILS